MGAASALDQAAHILSPQSQALERTRPERADRTGALFSFTPAERSSQEVGPGRPLLVHHESRIEQQLRRLARRQTGCRALIADYGIGEPTARTILCELGDVTRLLNGELRRDLSYARPVR